jgi:thiol-disulfide isomerase/thioredoxin
VKLALLLFLLLSSSDGLTPLESTGYRNLIRSYRGSVVLVSFWATWCIPCREELPALAALQTKYPELRLVTVSTDDADAAQLAARMLRDSKVQGKAYIRTPGEPDDAFIPAVDARWSGALPASFLYGRDGALQRRFVGETPTSELETAVKAALRR